MSTEQKTIDTFFMTIVGLFGAIFSGLSFDVLNGLDGKCPSVWVKNGWTGIMALGGCMIMACLMFFSCVYMGTGACYQNLGIRRGEKMYIGLLVLIALVCLGIAIAMFTDMKKIKSDDYACNLTKSKKYTIVVIVLSIIIVLLSITSLFVLKPPEEKVKQRIEIKDDEDENENNEDDKKEDNDENQMKMFLRGFNRMKN